MGLDILEVDVHTPHPGVSITGSLAHRETNGGWVTLRSKQALSNENRQWAVRVMDQGEGNDGSGLMIGLLPQLSNTLVSSMDGKYISELGGWCLSRAGDSYGSWHCERLPFSTDCVMEFDWEPEDSNLYIVCGKKKVVAHILTAGATDVLYPAFSMYYLNQKVAFV